MKRKKSAWEMASTKRLRKGMVPSHNEEILSSLAQQIVHQTAFVFYSLEGDKRVVYKSLQKKSIQALIIHKK
jgi:hypothetical protein